MYIAEFRKYYNFSTGEKYFSLADICDDTGRNVFIPGCWMSLQKYVIEHITRTNNTIFYKVINKSDFTIEGHHMYCNLTREQIAKLQDFKGF